MNVRFVRITVLAVALLAAVAAPVLAQTRPAAAARKVRVTGVVRDEGNAISLPGIPVEVVGGETVYTDVDGRYVLELDPGTYELKVAMEGYQPRSVKVDVVAGQRPPDLNIGLSMAAFAETVTVTAAAPLDAVTSSAAAQLVERKQAPIITDNLGAQEMRSNNDGDAAAAMQRVTGISVVDNQYVFVRGLGERYSNTTLSGATLPTTEPDKKVVPLDMFPSGLLDSVQVAKSYSPDKSAEFAGGLVQVNPIKLPSRPVFDVSYGITAYEIATGKSIPLSPLGSRDWLGFDNGSRALPARSRIRRSCAAASSRRTSASRPTRSPSSAAPSTTPGGRPARTAPRAELGHRRRQPLRQARPGGQPLALLQGAVRQGRPRLLPRG
jgi:hypothetical protein